MSDDARGIPDYLVERAAAGDLPADRERAVMERLAAEGGTDRLAALARDGAATLATLPPRGFAAEVARRATVRRRSHRLLVTALAGAAAVATVVVILPGAPDRQAEPPDDVIRVKGMLPSLVLHRSAGTGDERLAPGARLRAGDLVQLGYVATGARYGVIVSVDGRGVATRHWPIVGERAAALTSQREVLLPESFRLDDAPGFERFFLVTADHPFRVEEVVRAASELASRRDAPDAPLSLDRALSTTSFLVLKEVR